MNVFEMAKLYYPRLWNDERIDALLQAGKLTLEQVAELKSNKEVR